FPNHCEFETGKEGELRKWIMHQPDNSVDPLMLFKRSLLINRSNPFNAILTIHQLLRNEARYYKTNYYNYSSDPEKERLFFNKLVDIRGDLAERGGDSHGDHEGTRYRIWGIMLYRISSNTSANHAVCDSGFSNTYNDLKTSVMAVLAELLKTLSSKPLGDKRKMEINLVGANIANSMIDSMRDPELLSDRVRLEHLCDNRLYIKYSK
ncbi:MAG: hypothetical protein ACXVCA_18455, partial [Bdellovibrio sp.]